MDKNYYTIISRDEFIKLYRFGNIKVNANFILSDDKDIENKIIELFKVSYFEYEEGYLILKIIDKTIDSNLNFLTIKVIHNLEIEHIKSVYVLSNQAQQFYKTKVNQKVNFQLCPFPNILERVSKFKEYQNIDEGITILSKQFDFINTQEIDTKLGSDFKSNFLKIEDYLKLDFKSFYLDLLFYKRENKLTNDDIGYVYDLMLIVSLQKRNPQSINKFVQGQLKLNTSPAYQKLNINKKETLFENIEFIQEKNDEDIKRFTDNIGIDDLVTGTIFLKIKNLLDDENRNENTRQNILDIIDSFSSKYKDSLSMALYLIGLVFGYKNLYEDYYVYLGLDIFKEVIEKTPALIEESKEDVESKKKFEELQKENKELKLKLEKMQEPSNKETTQNDSDIVNEEESNNVISESNSEVDAVEEKEEIENHIILKSNLNDEEIVQYSITFLREIANNKNIHPINKDLYPNDKQGKIKLYNKIFNIEEVE